MTADAMDQQPELVVFLDGSQDSWRAIEPVLGLARAGCSPVSVAVLDQSEPTPMWAALGCDEIDRHALAADTINVLRETRQRFPLPALSFSRRQPRFKSVLESCLNDLGYALVVGPRCQEVGPTPQPVVVAVDTVTRTDPLIQGAALFVTSATPSVVLNYVVSPSGNDIGFTIERERAKFASSLCCPVEVVAVRSDSVEDAVAATARKHDASLIVARTWHGGATASLASTTLDIVEYAPCPILICQRAPRVITSEASA